MLLSLKPAFRFHQRTGVDTRSKLKKKKPFLARKGFDSFDAELIFQIVLWELAPSPWGLVAVESTGPFPPPLLISRCDNTTTSVILSRMEKTVRSFTRGVLQTLNRYQLLTEGDHTLVALSGGPDSVALLLVLQELRDRLSLELSAAHLNHQLRGRRIGAG